MQYRDLAAWIGKKFAKPVSVNTIRALVASTAYQMVVYSQVFWRSKLSRQWRWRRDDR